MRFVWLLVAVLVTLSVAVVSAQDADPAKEPPPDFKLRKIADVKPAKQTWKSREVIRNGGFDYGTAAWAMKGGLQVVAAESGRAGDDKDLGAGVEVTSVFSTSGFLSQMLHQIGRASCRERVFRTV